jgi:hypothetical protein
VVDGSASRQSRSLGIKMKMKIVRWLGVIAGICIAAGSQAQMVTGAKMPGFAEAFGLTAKPDVEVRQLSVDTGSSTMVDILGDGEQAHLVFHLTNRSNEDIRGKATFRLVHYGTAVPEGDVWVPHVFKIGDIGSTPVELNMAKGASQDVSVTPEVPSEYGGYALVLDIPGRGSIFAATLARVIAPERGRVQFPTYALDTEWPNNMNEGVYTLMEKLGIKGVRVGTGFNLPSDPAYKVEQARLQQDMDWARKHDVTVMLTLGGGSAHSAIQPLGRSRPWLSPDGAMLKTKEDYAWLPAYDNDFQAWTAKLAEDYGWPKGNLNAVELWNEPWEGISISGWGADIPRYRDIYTHMANGIVEAREKADVKVLIGGTCSSANARDKLFSDGTDKFLPIFDFVSVHYQALSADPTLEPKWMNRQSPYGPVRVWDTESWIANSEDRIAGVIASMRAQGQSRTAGVFRGNVYDSSNYKLNGKVYPVVQAYPAAAAIAATQKFIGQRPFREILFHNGLPWVFVFDGLTDDTTGKIRPDDGTVVIVGNLAKIYPVNRTLFRSVKLSDKAAIAVPDLGGAVKMFDFYGNPLPSKNGTLIVPLNGLGYFLRSDGSAGSFAKLIEAVRKARIDGIEPVEITARDMTAPVNEGAKLRIQLTNVLNRSVRGDLRAQLAGLALSQAPPIVLAPNETREIVLNVSGSPAASNTYPLSVRFDAGADGSAQHAEEMHANVIARRTIKVDGDLSDWKGVLPQILPGSGISASLTEKAYLPFVAMGDSQGTGASTVWLAYDDKNFYFAAKITDATPDEGMVRFENRDDDSYFYPDQVTAPDGTKLSWPAGVRHFSYRQNFDDPAGTSRSVAGRHEHDNVQIAFNVLDKKPWLPYPPGTMPRFIDYWDTDYEYALNNVAAQYGGGVEIWRLLAPGVPVKSFFPREPHSAIDGGPVKTGQLISRREGNLRIVEAAIPWSEIPDVYKKIAAGGTVKFSCRVNDNAGESRELAEGRSVSKENGPAFHDSWQTHWANEVEFGVEK